MQRTVFAAFLGAVIIIMGFTACSEERYWTPDQSTGEEIRDIMKENWDLIEDVWGDADCGDFPDGSGSKSMMAVRSIVVPGIIFVSSRLEKAFWNISPERFVVCFMNRRWLLKPPNTSHYFFFLVVAFLVVVFLAVVVAGFGFSGAT